MRKFTYIDRTGIMHIVKDMQTAVDYAKKGTRVIETEIETKHGYPVVDGKGVIVYGVDEMKTDAQGAKIAPVAELADLYRQCMGE